MDSFEQLYEIVKTLRSPDGCPWDREQTPYSLRTNQKFIARFHEPEKRLKDSGSSVEEAPLLSSPDRFHSRFYTVHSSSA